MKNRIGVVCGVMLLLAAGFVQAAKPGDALPSKVEASKNSVLGLDLRAGEQFGEAVVGFAMDERTLKFEVVSYGCTDESYFKLAVDYEMKTPPVWLVRTKRDTCNRSPRVIAIYYDRENYNILHTPRVEVKNAFASLEDIHQPKQDQGNRCIRSEVKAPEKVYINRMPGQQDGAYVEMRIVPILYNCGNTSVKLSVPNSCSIHDWTIVDRSGRTIQVEQEGRCLNYAQTYTLKPGETLKEQNIIRLNIGSLMPGQTYTVKYAFRGVASETSFRVGLSN